MKYKNIVVWQTAFLGDLILTTPLFHSIKNIFPDAKLSVISKPFGKEVLKNNPYIDNLIIFDKKNISNWKLLKLLKKYRFDLAISPHRSHRASYTLFLAGIKRRIGFDRAGFSFLYTDTVKHRFDGTHEIDRNLSLLKPLNNYREDKLYKYPEIFLTEEEEKSYKKFKLDDKSYTVIASGSKWATKRWTVEGFSELINILLKSGETVVLFGSKEDIEYTNEILKNIDNEKNLINLVGKTDLRESFSIIKHAKILISNDSAPIHMAVSFNTPVVDIYGPTITEFGFYPYRNGIVVEFKNLSCRPCGLHGHKSCPEGHFKCMKSITANDILKAYYEKVK